MNTAFFVETQIFGNPNYDGTNNSTHLLNNNNEIHKFFLSHLISKIKDKNPYQQRVKNSMREYERLGKKMEEYITE